MNIFFQNDDYIEPTIAEREMSISKNMHELELLKNEVVKFNRNRAESKYKTIHEINREIHSIELDIAWDKRRIERELNKTK